MPREHATAKATRNLAAAMGIPYQAALKKLARANGAAREVCFCGHVFSWDEPGDDHCCACGATGPDAIMAYICVCKPTARTETYDAAASETYRGVVTVNHALLAIEQGHHVFPIPPGEKRPAGGWQELVTNDPDVVRATWPVGANVGIACKESRLVVLDLDLVDDGATLNGYVTLDQLLRPRGETNPDPHVTTPSGGYHVYYRVPDGLEVLSVSEWMPGIDVRGNVGGYVLAAGSRLPYDPEAGRWSEVYTYTALHSNAVEELPGWLARILPTSTAPVPA